LKINRIIKEASNVADNYNLQFVELDRTDNIVSLNLLIDNDISIQIYGNAKKDKLNLALVFKKKRLYGYDAEGGKYHCHPFDNPDEHIFVNEKKSISEFAQEAMGFLEEKDIL